MFTATFIAEYNDTVTQLQITAMRILKRLLDTETEPKALRQLTAIAFRARKLTDPDAPRTTRTRPNRARQEAERTANPNRAREEAERTTFESNTSPPTPSAPVGDSSLPSPRPLPANHPHQDALTGRIPPLRSRHPQPTRSPLALIQSAASASPLQTLAAAS